MSLLGLDILTVRNNDLEVVIKIVETSTGQWRVYKWYDQQCQNWRLTVGRRFNSCADALIFIQEKGYVIAFELERVRAETPSQGQGDADA
jgi:hypothetical protein